MRSPWLQRALALVVAAGLISGCSSAKKAAPPPACRRAHPSQYPGARAALTDADAGGTYCAIVGETLSVTLHVPPGDTGPPWQPFTSSDPSVLAPVRHGVAAVPQRATATLFSVRKPGVVTIIGRRTTATLFNIVIVARAK